MFSDGAARGNPGPAAIAFSIYDDEGALIDSGARPIGVATNNDAEYQALILAMDRACVHSRETVHFFLDSELVVKQVTGKYRARNTRMKAYLKEVQSRMMRFREVRVSNVPRENERIQRVDEMVNEVLDRTS